MYSADTVAFSEEVSPSVANVKMMIRRMRGTNDGDTPDIVITTEDVWDALAAQVESQPYLQAQAARMSKESVDLGFDALYILGTPVVSDRFVNHDDFNAQGGTRPLALGHEMYFLDFSHLKLGYIPKRAFKWDPDGWVRPDNYDSYLNKLYFWGQCSTDSRRHLGRIFNVAPTQTPDEFTRGEVNLPVP